MSIKNAVFRYFFPKIVILAHFDQTNHPTIYIIGKLYISAFQAKISSLQPVSRENFCNALGKTSSHYLTLCLNYPARRASCYSQSVPPKWGGARLFAVSEGHPHGNGRSSETKSLKMDPKVPNRSYRRGLQTGYWRNPGSSSKKRTFGLKSENFGQKKRIHFFTLTMFRPWPGNVVQRKKYRFTK